MSKYTDQIYLKHEQYRDSSNLDARIVIHQRFSTNPQGWFGWVFDALETLPSQAHVLELGCGSGLLWSTCPDRIPAGWKITLSDLSEGMLLAAWRNLVVTGRAFKYKQIDAQSIPYTDGTFDIVIANHMLYHVPDRSKALQEIWRVLKPGGHLVAATVGEEHMREVDTWLKQVSLSKDYTPSRAAFTLENGQQELALFFTDVSIHRYIDSLRITEISPLIAYIRSSVKVADISETEFVSLQQTLESELRLKNELVIIKDTGLFVATH
jgi:SAM-dependent methyltransferase